MKQRLAPCNGTQQWHHVHTPKALPSPLQWHPAMAPSNGTTSTPPKLVVTLHLNHSTLQWHPTMAPSNGTTSTPPKLSPSPLRTIAHYNGTLQWHPTMHHVHSPKVGRHPPPQPWHTTMAPYNGTTSTPPKLVVTLHLNHSTLQWHPTMAPSNGTTSTPPKLKLVVTLPPTIAH